MNTVSPNLTPNSRGDAVADLHAALTLTGGRIGARELELRQFGPRTVEAVRAFQRDHDLPPTGVVDDDTAKRLTALARDAIKNKTGAAAKLPRFEVRGTVRGVEGVGVGGLTVRVYEKRLRDEAPLATGYTHTSGFFRIAYHPPMTGRDIKPRFQAIVRVFTKSGDERHASKPFVASKDDWLDFTDAARPFAGYPEFDTHARTLARLVGDTRIEDLVEDERRKDLSFLAVESGLSPEAIMRLVVAARLEQRYGIAADVFYAFLRFATPRSLPDGLIDASDRFQRIDALVDDIARGIVFLDDLSLIAAVRTAVQRNIIGVRFVDGLDPLVKALVGLRERLMLDQPLLVGKTSLATLLGLADIPDAKHGRVAAALAQHRVPSDRFWNALSEGSGALTDRERHRLERVVTIGGFVKNHPPMVDTIARALDEGDVADLPSLARGGVAAVRALVDRAGADAVPPAIAGDTLDKRAATFALETHRALQRAYTRAAVVGAIERRGHAVLARQDTTLALLDANPDLELLTANLDQYFATTGAASFAAVAANDRPAVRRDTHRVQRALRLAGDPEAATTLLAANLDSAARIYFTGKRRFVADATAGGISLLDAKEIFHTAEQRYALTLIRYGRYNRAFNALDLPVLADPAPTADAEPQIAQSPTLQALFGSLDYCECGHCRSVYGAAAYLVDVLHWLILRPANGGSAKDILFRRRPDLGRILLNCANTDTEVPFIDLVCEVLEDLAAPPAIGAQPRNLQTTLASADLRAYPEHLHVPAYENALHTARFPMRLPFHLWLTEGRAYLAHLGIERWRLMATLQDRLAPGPAHHAIAADYFGLSALATTLITQDAADAAAQAVFWQEPNPVAALAPVDTFLRRAAIGFRDLQQLLESTFVNGANPRSAIAAAAASPCDTSAMQITNLSLGRLDRAHRFVRLWRATGWTMHELDLLLAAANVGGASPANEAAFRSKLAELRFARMIQTRLKLTGDEVHALFADLDTRLRATLDTGQLPIYQRLFRQRLFTDPATGLVADPALDLAAVTAPAPPAVVLGHVAAVIAGLGVTEADLRLLLGAGPTPLSLANLSHLYRHTRLASALDLRVADLLALIALAGGGSPFAAPSVLWRFLDLVDDVRREAARATLDDIAFVLRPEVSSAVARSDAASIESLDRVRRELVESGQAFAVGADGKPGLVARLLATVPAIADPDDPLVLAQALAIVDGTWSTAAPGRGALTDAERRQFIADRLGGFIDVGTAQAALAALATPARPEAAREAEVEARFDIVIGALRAAAARRVIVRAAASTFALRDGQAEQLVSTLRVPAGATLLAVLLDARLTEQVDGAFVHPLDRATFPDQFDALRVLEKTALVIRAHLLTPAEFAWLHRYGGAAGLIDLAALPVQAAAAAIPLDRWTDTQRFLRVSRRFPGPERDALLTAVASAIDGAAFGDVFAAIRRATGWSRDDLNIIGQQLSVDGTAPLGRAESYWRLAESFDLLKRAGVSGDTLVSWLNEDLTQADAAAIRSAVRARYDLDRWRAVSAQIQDVVREQKRAALVHYALARPPAGAVWRQPSDVSEHLLIDVEMGACDVTSRIVQATQAVQLFVERALMNLEPDVPVDPQADDGWVQWQWMRRYRVWEANRKVFLYPENWLLPEVRRDRSPFFRELESELAQNEVTDENVEVALQHYLEKLDDVANLEVAAMCRDESDTHDTIHVVGRTRGGPRVHYYRRRVDGVWTAWEKIDLDIKGDHLMLAVYHRRPHLFWPVFSAKPDPAQGIPAQAGNDPPPETRSFWEIQLAWSVRRSNRWTAARVSEAKLIHPWHRPTFSFSFRWWEDGPNLEVGLFIRSSHEFNDRTFVDPVTRMNRPYSVSPYREDHLPWHSSSFVFNGDVIEIRLKRIRNSLEVVHGYGEHGRRIEELVAARPLVLVPNGLHFESQRMAANRESGDVGELHAIEPRRNGQLYDRWLLLDAANLPDSGNVVPPPSFWVVSNSGDVYVDTTQPFFFFDRVRTFFVVATPFYDTRAGLSPFPGSGSAAVPSEFHYRFYDFCQPHAKLFARELDRGGVAGLFRRELQTQPDTLPPLYPGAVPFAFNAYAPRRPFAEPEHEGAVVDFALSGAYALYNWELFYHVPVLIAMRLAANQRHEEALRWFHFVFNPTLTAPPGERRRFWIAKPLYELTDEQIDAQRITRLLEDVAADVPGALSQVHALRTRPFDPHLVASLRWVAYQKFVVIQYVKTLVAWGDQLFRADRREALTIAGLLYERARGLLGSRPLAVAARGEGGAMTFDQLEPRLDEFSNVAEEIENTLGPTAFYPYQPVPNEPLPRLGPFYFCIPPNAELLQLWDLVDQRLDNLRHCRDIEGRGRKVALFEPPIDPLALIRAAAAGADLTSVGADAAVAHPGYRFQYTLQAALGFVNDVRTFGSELLAVLEKRDAEQLTSMRARHERTLAELTDAARVHQIDEAMRQRLALDRQEAAVVARRQYYDTRPFMNTWEQVAFGLGAAAAVTHSAGLLAEALASIAHQTPNVTVGGAGWGGTPVATLTYGGDNAGQSAARGASIVYQIASLLDRLTGLSATMATYQRRRDDWVFQKEQADLELLQIAVHKAAADARVNVALQERTVQQQQLLQAQETEELLRTKFTNQELYDWMVAELSALYFQAYLAAFDACRRAEDTFRWELGEFDASYVRFGSWDSLRKGLLAGERLVQDLRRLESAYNERNRRAFEITRSVSLAEIDPLALIELRQNGECRIALPEALFDRDHPGHYLRRIKTVGVTIPCIVGPYTSVNCTLTLERSTIRLSNLVGAGYARQGANDARFRDLVGAGEAIVTSSGQGDSGLFELSLRDERYLPFEGAGAESDWRISLPRDTNAFDVGTVTDVVLHLRYTALDGGGALRDAARQAVVAALPRDGVLSFSARRDFPDAWQRFLHPAAPAADQELAMRLGVEHVPYAVRAAFADLRFTRVDLFSDYTGNDHLQAALLPLVPENAAFDLDDRTLAGVQRGFAALNNVAPGAWRLKLKPSNAADFRSLPDADITEVLIVLTYRIV